METYFENRKAIKSALVSIMIGIILTIAIEASFTHASQATVSQPVFSAVQR